MLLALFAVAAAGVAALLAPEETPPPSPPSTAFKPVVPTRWFTGPDGLAEAERLQGPAGARLLVLFTSDVCADCERVDRFLSSDPIAGKLERVAKVRISVGTSPAETAVVNRFKLQDVPAVFLIAASGVTPAPLPASSFSSPDEFVAALETASAAGAQELVVGGNRLVENGRVQEASEALSRAIELDAGNAEAHYWRGVVRARLGDKAAAVEDFQRAVELHRDYAEAYDYLGYLLIDAGRLDEAIANLDRLIALRPEYQKGRAYYLRGGAHFRKGNLASALADAAKACELGSDEACRVRGSVGQ
ncbi:MAG: tetratricopeptide repeat protein [Myxococcales bacterium]|nr:tetratricopeptide repeat protein [Myxococcales bacterium]